MKAQSLKWRVQIMSICKKWSLSSMCSLFPWCVCLFSALLTVLLPANTVPTGQWQRCVCVCVFRREITNSTQISQNVQLQDASARKPCCNHASLCPWQSISLYLYTTCAVAFLFTCSIFRCIRTWYKTLNSAKKWEGLLRGKESELWRRVKIHFNKTLLLT